MNVNPFSYLIEKLKSKADKTDLANYLKIDLTTYGTQTNYVHDFNDITTTGNYWCYCKYSDTQNQPLGVGTPNGVLMVTNSAGDGITQLYIDRTNNRIYSRTYRASWSAWGTVALTSDLGVTYSKTVSNMSINSAVGNLFEGVVGVPTDTSGVGKRVVATFVPTSSFAFAVIRSVTASEVNISLEKGNSGTVSGTVYVTIYP